MKHTLFLLGVTVGIAWLILLGVFGICTANFIVPSSYSSTNAPLETQSTELIISNNSTANQLPAVAYNPDRDEYLVVWRSQQADGYDIRGQYLDSDGVLVRADFTVTTPISVSWPRLPAVAYNSTQKEFLVVWNNEISNSLHGQRVLSDGVLIGSPFTITTPLSDYPHGPALAYAPADDVFLLAWRGCVQSQQSVAISPNGGGGPCYFYTQVLDGKGAEISENITATTNTYMQSYPALTYMPDLHEFWIVWTEQYTITAQRILTTGLLISEPFTIAQGTTEMFNPSISNTSSRGEFLVTWENMRYVLSQSLNPMGGGGYRDIYARRVLSSGVPAGDSFRVSNVSSTALEPKTVYLSGQDQYFVAWVSIDYQNHHQGIYARWISETGETLGHDFPVVVEPEDQFQVAVAGDNMVLVAWQDNRGGPDIRGRILERPWWVYLPLVMRAG